MEIEKYMRLSRKGNANAGLHPGILPYVCLKASVQDVYAAEYIKQSHAAVLDLIFEGCLQNWWK